MASMEQHKPATKAEDTTEQHFDTLTGPAIPKESALEKTGVAVSKDLFTKYRFKIVDDGSVEFTLPQGASYTQLYDDCNKYIADNQRYKKWDV